MYSRSLEGSREFAPQHDRDASTRGVCGAIKGNVSTRAQTRYFPTAKDS